MVKFCFSKVAKHYVLTGYYYRPQTKLWEGNDFTGVCLSVHRDVWQQAAGQEVLCIPECT